MTEDEKGRVFRKHHEIIQFLKSKGYDMEGPDVAWKKDYHLHKIIRSSENKNFGFLINIIKITGGYKFFCQYGTENNEDKVIGKLETKIGEIQSIFPNVKFSTGKNPVRAKIVFPIKEYLSNVEEINVEDFKKIIDIIERTKGFFNWQES